MAEEQNISTAEQSLPSSARTKVLVLRDYCIKHRGADCQRCAVACPHDAITFTEENIPRIDPQLCTSCGICFGVCDAFSSNKVTLLDLHERIKHIALTGDQVYFTCSENIFPDLTPANNVIVLPCLACVPPELWALILAENIGITLACDLEYCIDCDRAGPYAESFYKHTIQVAEDWTGGKLRYKREIPEKKKLVDGISRSDAMDRRSAFTNFWEDLGDIATGKRRVRNSEVLRDFVLKREKSRAAAQLRLSEIDEINRFAPLGHTKKTMFPKRKMILEAINLNPDIAEKVVLDLARITKQDSSLKDFVSLCPTGALAPDPKTGEIDIESRYCIGCKICAEAAPQMIEMIETNAAALFVPHLEEQEELNDKE